VHYWP